MHFDIDIPGERLEELVQEFFKENQSSFSRLVVPHKYNQEYYQKVLSSIFGSKNSEKYLLKKCRKYQKN